MVYESTLPAIIQNKVTLNTLCTVTLIVTQEHSSLYPNINKIIFLTKLLN